MRRASISWFLDGNIAPHTAHWYRCIVLECLPGSYNLTARCERYMSMSMSMSMLCGRDRTVRGAQFPRSTPQGRAPPSLSPSLARSRSLPPSLTSSLPQFLTPSLPHFLSPSLPIPPIFHKHARTHASMHVQAKR